jgi:hypothetical protein
MVRRLFTPGSARAVLAAVRGPAETVRSVWRSIEALGPPRVACDRPVDRRYFVLARRLWFALDAIDRAGVTVCDPRTGRLGFPASRAGRLVMLSWKVGEPDVGHWHEPPPGLESRRPLDEDGPWDR